MRSSYHKQKIALRAHGGASSGQLRFPLAVSLEPNVDRHVGKF